MDAQLHSFFFFFRPATLLHALGLIVLPTSVQTSSNSEFRTESRPNSLTTHHTQISPLLPSVPWHVEAGTPDPHPLTCLPPARPHHLATQYRTWVSLYHSLNSNPRAGSTSKSSTQVRSCSSSSHHQRSAGLLR